MTKGTHPTWSRVTSGLPDSFPPPEKGYSLYDGIDYQDYWQSPARIRQDALERLLISELLPVSGHRIIDVGCGFGRLTPLYVDRFEHAVLYDGSMSLLRQAHDALGDRVTLVAGDILRMPFKPSSFDCLLTIRVLSHMRDLASALSGMERIVANDGALVFSYHNKRNARRILRFPLVRGPGNPFSSESAEIQPTLISHHPSRFETLLLEAGFSPPEYRGAVVVNALASVGDRLGRRAPAGAGWARLTGRYRLAPWLVGRSRAERGGALRPSESIDELLQCPACSGDLSRSDDGYECAACHRHYPVDDGILDFRIADAG